MKQWPELKPVAWDAAVVAAVLLLALLCGARFWLGGSGSTDLTVIVSVDGQEVERFAPDAVQKAAKQYSGGGYTLTVTAGNKGAASICVAESDCPTQDCVHTGTIYRSGQSIVCLPARIVIRLVGGAEPPLDAVLG